MMETKKNKNILRSIYAGSHGIDYIVDYFKNLLKQKEELVQRKICFEEQTQKKDENTIGVLKFKEKKYIYNLISNLYDEETNNDKKWELGFIKQHLRGTFEDLAEYYNIRENLEKVIEAIRDINKYINFDNFKNEKSHKTCIEQHFFVRLKDELVCMRCGETTKNYDLTNEELDFLTFCAEKKHCLIDRITEDEIPFIKVIMAEHQYYRDHRTPLSEFSEAERIDYQMEYSMTDEEEFGNIQRELKVARALDSCDFYNDNIKLINPAYLRGSRINELSNEIEKTMDEIKNSDSKHKDLLLEQCLAAKYELYILNGYRIPALLTKNSIDNTIALVKAYYNLSNQQFRLESGYFDPSPRNYDALSYSCRTANPEINQMILDLKLKRKNI